MDNNSDALRFVSCGCFGGCLLLSVADLLSLFIDSFKYLTFTNVLYLMMPNIGLLFIILGLIIKNRIIIAIGGGICALNSIIRIIDYIMYASNSDYYGIELFEIIFLVGTWIMVILIALMGMKYGKIFGALGGVMWVLSGIMAVYLNKMINNTFNIGILNYLYYIGMLGAIIVLGLSSESLFVETASYGGAGRYRRQYGGSGQYNAYGQYGASAPGRQYRRHDASAPNGENDVSQGRFR